MSYEVIGSLSLSDKSVFRLFGKNYFVVKTKKLTKLILEKKPPFVVRSELLMKKRNKDRSVDSQEKDVVVCLQKLQSRRRKRSNPIGALAAENRKRREKRKEKKSVVEAGKKIES